VSPAAANKNAHAALSLDLHVVAHRKHVRAKPRRRHRKVVGVDHVHVVVEHLRHHRRHPLALAQQLDPVPNVERTARAPQQQRVNDVAVRQAVHVIVQRVLHNAAPPRPRG